MNLKTVVYDEDVPYANAIINDLANGDCIIACCDGDAMAERDALLLQQHQGEPVAWAQDANLKAAPNPDSRYPTKSMRDDANGYSVPLYRHAEPAEVEGLRVELDTLIRALETADSEVTILRAQLAEAHALLRDLLMENISPRLAGCIEVCLSASAESSAPLVKVEDVTFISERGTSAPVEIDERAEFEKAGSRMGVEARLLTGREWRIWQARAALSTSAEPSA